MNKAHFLGLSIFYHFKKKTEDKLREKHTYLKLIVRKVGLAKQTRPYIAPSRNEVLLEWSNFPLQIWHFVSVQENTKRLIFLLTI